MRTPAAGIVLGIGLGGFVDGILLHQILQWHNMGSAVLPPTDMHAMSVNMRWDGLFHAATWAITFVGIYMLRTEARRDHATGASQFTGQMIFGWGAFNLVEGIIDHQILNLHHVVDLPFHVPLYDWLFLAIAGVGFLFIGWLLMRPGPVGVRQAVLE
jgi:uncharacterized membrane protein